LGTESLETRENGKGYNMSKFDDLITRFHNYSTTDGNYCITMGIQKNSESLPDLSEEYQQNQEREEKELRRELKNFDRTGLTFNQALDLDLALFLMEQELFQDTINIDGEDMGSKKPTMADEICDPIFALFVNDPREPKVRLDNILSRIQQTPEYLVDSVDYLIQPVKRWVESEIVALTSVPEFYDNILGWADSCRYDKLSELAAAMEQAKQGIDSYVKKLKKMKTSKSFALGEKQTRKLIKKNGIELSLEKLKELAVNFLQQNNKEIEDLRLKLCSRYQLSLRTPTLALQEYLNKKFQLTNQKPSSVLEQYQNEKAKIMDFVSAKKFFPVAQENDFAIIQTPKHMEPTIPSGEMLQPRAFRPGVKTSVVYVTLTKDSISEHTQLTIPLMIAHEGLGHHQAYANAYSAESIVRKHCDYLDVAEGWSTYMERYLIDQGYMGAITDEVDFVTKINFNRLGARVLIDLYFMTGDLDYLNVGVIEKLSSSDPFKNAAQFYQELTGCTDVAAESEVEWSSKTPGQPLTYLAGNFLVNQLKNDMAKKTKLTGLELDQAFHKALLEYGTIPISFIRRAFQNQGLVD
jgi:uncharacterized protein (DUF885 family)